MDELKKEIISDCVRAIAKFMFYHRFRTLPQNLDTYVTEWLENEFKEKSLDEKQKG